MLCDPNLIACPDWKDLLWQLIDSKAKVDINQGIICVLSHAAVVRLSLFQIFLLRQPSLLRTHCRQRRQRDFRQCEIYGTGKQHCRSVRRSCLPGNCSGRNGGGQLFSHCFFLQLLPPPFHPPEQIRFLRNRSRIFLAFALWVLANNLDDEMKICRDCPDRNNPDAICAGCATDENIKDLKAQYEDLVLLSVVLRVLVDTQLLPVNPYPIGRVSDCQLKEFVRDVLHCFHAVHIVKLIHFTQRKSP